MNKKSQQMPTHHIHNLQDPAINPIISEGTSTKSSKI